MAGRAPGGGDGPSSPERLSSRAYRALNRVCVGLARRVRFKSKSRGLDSLENKRNDTGLRFVLQTRDEGQPQGYLLWYEGRLVALIDWNDPVVAHNLSHPIKYARLVRRRASGPRAKAADRKSERYFVQLALSSVPYQKPKHTVGTDTIGLDLGPASITIVPREAEANLVPLCAELRPEEKAMRRQQHKMERKLRAANRCRTTMTGDGPRSAAKALRAGSRAGAIRKASEVSPRENAG